MNEAEREIERLKSELSFLESRLMGRIEELEHEIDELKRSLKSHVYEYHSSEA